MHFNLPDQLALEVAGYDQTRKKLAAVMAAEDRKAKKKNTHPNGRPSNLIPSDVVNDRTWNEVVDIINSKSVKQGKVHLITKPVFGEDPQPVAVVYYYKQLWVAAWIPRRKDDGYVYGLSFTFKDTAAARKQCDQKFISKLHSTTAMFDHLYGSQDDMLPRIKDGRTFWYRKTLFFTKDDFADGFTTDYWRKVTENHNICNYGATYELSKVLTKWSAQLFKTIPTFTGGNDSSFARMNPENCKFINIMQGYYSRPRWANHTDDYVHDLDTILNVFRRRWRHSCVQEVWDAKWFRSKVAQSMKDTYAIHEEQTALLRYNREALVKPYAILYQFIDSMLSIKPIYEDMDLNLLHSRYDWLCRCELPGYHTETGYQWMRDNLPVESFLNMLHMHYKHELEEKDWAREDSKTGNKHVYFSLWRDTYQMLTQCIAAGRIDNIKPKRWRLQEWHDHLMAETWKISNPNIDLPQKLFPTPIKVKDTKSLYLNTDSVYSFFQPHDTHQLAAWGRAVRNCVGGGHGYAEGIKKMKHLIILCMIDNKPRYTIQLTVDNGVMTVNQIADVGNARLNDQERADVEDVFKKALKIREDELKS
jgi:hypothetical protein|tara:strand:- start:10554 stop:12320 length:1767 start_codon:yes stop_codon:yes gene_type:complete